MDIEELGRSRHLQTPCYIPMGSGGRWYYDHPSRSRITIEDYAWALAGQARFSGQTRLTNPDGSPGQRVLYTVLDHVVIMALAMMDIGLHPAICLSGLLHESDEIVFPDVPQPIKARVPELNRQAQASAEELDRRFGNLHPAPEIVKAYDLRMLATEKRDLVPHEASERWPILDRVEPFGWKVTPVPAQERVDQFLRIYDYLHVRDPDRGMIG